MKRCIAVPILLHVLSCAEAAGPALQIDTPMSPPTWALLQRSLLDANSAACNEFFNRYFDERGWLLCVERWGGDDGPDDAIENLKDWPLLHALGGADDMLHMVKKAWEGHLRQFTLARTTEVPFARDGMVGAYPLHHPPQVGLRPFYGHARPELYHRVQPAQVSRRKAIAGHHRGLHHRRHERGGLDVWHRAAKARCSDPDTAGA